MSPPAKTGRAASRRSRRRQQEVRRRRLAVLTAVAVVAAVTLLLTAFGGGERPSPAPSQAAPAVRLLPAGPPVPKAIARIGALQLELPVNAGSVTAIGYFGAQDGSLALQPIGSQANAGFLTRIAHALVGGGGGSPRWYMLPGGHGTPTSALDVGAAPGTDVFSPVDGTVVGIGKVVLDGRAYGSQIDIQPTNAPSLVVSVSHVTVDPSLAVGSMVTADASKLGVVLDFSKVEQQPLARYTNDAGDHVLIEVHPSTTIQAR